MSTIRSQEDWSFHCPRCQGPLERGHAAANCRACSASYSNTDGIWRFLAPGRLQRFQGFLDSYTRIRLAEGRGAPDPGFYRQLPRCADAHPLAAQWRVRARSMSALLRLLVDELAPGARVLDLGAGNGWLSHRLEQAGFRPAALDLSVDDQDGLGAARHYQPEWPRLQAEFDRIPLPSRSVDATVFNGSLHYSGDYRDTLEEALRTLVPGGLLCIMDTPIYRDRSSGIRMKAEKHEDFQRRYGDRSDELPAREFLTWAELERLGTLMGLSWRVIRPWYGWRWAARKPLALLRRRREPATFALVWCHNPERLG